MTDRCTSHADLLSKIEWEGGVLAAYDYGIRCDDMPEGDDELAALWLKLEEKYKEVILVTDAIEKLLDGAVLADGEEERNESG
jgi:hypothetical protein